MKRVLNFQKLLLSSCIITMFPQERENRKNINDFSANILLMMPFVLMAWVDNDIAPLIFFTMLPISLLNSILFKDMAIFNTIPVTRRFVSANLMIISPITSLLFGLLALAIFIPLAFVDIAHGKPIVDIGIQKTIIIALVGFCLYVISFIILILDNKIKFFASVVYAVAFTSGIYFFHNSIPASYGRYNGDNALILSYVLKNFGFLPSLAAAAALAALFAFAGLAILPRLMLKRSIANA